MGDCPRCGSKRIIFDKGRGEYYCGSCGYVLTQIEVTTYIRVKQARQDTKNIPLKINSPHEDIRYYTLNEIKRISAVLHLPQYILLEAIRLYWEVYTLNLHRTQNISAEALAPALILLSLYKYDLQIDYYTLYYTSKEQPESIKRAYYSLFPILQRKSLRQYYIEKRN